GGKVNVSAPGASDGRIYLYAWPSPPLPLTIVVNGETYSSNSPEYFLNGLPAGDYEIVVTHAGGCSRTLHLTIGVDMGEMQNVVSGVVFEDWNQDGVRDAGEAPIPQHLVYITTESGDVFYEYTTTDDQGRYTFNLPAGNWRLYANTLFHSQPTLPATPYYSLSFTGNSSLTDNLDFGFGFEPTVDAAVTLTALNDPTPGGTVRYYITARNMGTVPLDGTFTFERDATLSNPFSPVAPSESNPPFFTWDYAALPPFGFANLYADCNVAPGASIGSWIVSRANIEPTDNDAYLPNNAYVCSTQVRAPYDPNVKLALDDEGAAVDTILETDAITYFIRFRNEGNAPAQNVVVVDTLAQDLDPRTFEMLGSSFPARFQITGKGRAVVRWTMENIQLPPAQTDALGSYGFVKFRIKTFENRPCETVVSNRAAIYFDFNEPIFTDYSRVLVDPRATAQIAAPDTVWVDENFTARATNTVNFRNSHALAWDNGATGAEAQYSFSTPGEQTLTLNLDGPEKSDCGQSVTRRVYVKGCPTPNHAQTRYEICPDSVVVLDASAWPGVWSDGYVGAIRPVGAAGNYVFEISLDGPCKDSHTFVVETKNCTQPCTPTQLPDVTTQICPFETTTLTAPKADATYRWSNGETTREIATYKEGEYTVTQTDANGCVESVKFVVRYQSCEGNAPSNVFTPNGDGRNDYWTIDGHGIERVQVWVFDRSGTTVFSHDGAAGFKWNGTFRGNELPPGTYFHRYRMTMRDGRVVEASGTITLLR
ncbi:MAG: gliding motility-associated C-terminal domain-containing protein, partial [Bacteroidia bacterium]|nr:gliding motility-associated C-terminal domain-containing protein [Bacteroidia bacterium]